jgi:hypothetical protein
MPATFSIPKTESRLTAYYALLKIKFLFFFYAEGILMMAQVKHRCFCESNVDTIEEYRRRIEFRISSQTFKTTFRRPLVNIPDSNPKVTLTNDAQLQLTIPIRF